jgi:DNA/RNA-binding domain of Phe-tRNA-synthetase-like protein
MSTDFPPEIRHNLDGWRTFWLRLRPTGGGIADLADLGADLVEVVRRRFEGAPATDDPGVAEIRRLFRAAGTDPTRYRPSSEALLRRITKGDPLPAIHPMVDLNNLLSLKLMVPCCVVDPRAVTPPFTFRAGQPGESMESMRGPFNLEGKPLLEDDEGPFGTPITDSERVKIVEDTGEVWLVAYLPDQPERTGEAIRAISELLAAAPVAELIGSSTD